MEQSEEPTTENSVSEKSISKAEINELPLIAWEGPIHLLQTLEEMQQATATILKTKVLGFDTETRPTFKKGQYYPPALVQLATEKDVFLFRINLVKTLAPLLPILESSDIVKAGVAIKDDVKELQAMEPFTPAGFCEISNLTSSLGYTNRGLRPLAGLFMEGRISKAAQVSNWARSELDTKQIRYAATDAWISRELYIRASNEADHRSET